MLGIDFPLIMAPMFLVSNTAMIKAAMAQGIAGTFPSLNYRKEGELEAVLDELNAFCKENPGKGTYGINLIVQKTNPLFQKHLDVCIAKKVPFFITSLGSPKETIERAHAYGAKVFCDVTNLTHAKKAYQAGCDGFIAVGQGAGGHAGNNPLSVLIPALLRDFPDKPVIGAGGMARGDGLLSVMAIGGEGVSVGTLFIASTEAQVGEAYKAEVLKAGMDDIVMSDRISGTPSTIINTPFAKKIGYNQNFIERFLSRNKTTRKYFKMLVQLRGIKRIEKSLKPGNYNSLFIAGKSVEFISEVLPAATIIERFKNETFEAFTNLTSKIKN